MQRKNLMGVESMLFHFIPFFFVPNEHEIIYKKKMCEGNHEENPRIKFTP
jgi:hypothetical protein